MKLEEPQAEIVAHPASEVQCVPQGWLWPPYLPRGHLSLLVGEPGVGKSLLSYELAAWTTTGRWPVWPEAEAPAPSPADVLMFCGEDAARVNVRQRLETAGADMDRVRLVAGVRADVDAQPGPFFLDQHGELLERLISAGDYGLVVLDPLTSFLSRGEPSSHGGARALLRPLVDAAQRHNVAMCAVLHLNKQSAGHALHRVAGSVAFTAAARSVLHVVEDGIKGGRRLLVSRKSNYSGPAPALAFEISSAGIRWEKEPVHAALAPTLGRVKMRSLAETVAWLRKRLTPKAPANGPHAPGTPGSSLTAAEAGAAPQVFIPPGASDSVRRVLQSMVPAALSLPSANDGVAVTDILEELEAERITERTLRRAKEHLCVKAFRPPGGKAGWRWKLP